MKFDGVDMAKRELTEVKGFGYKVDKNGNWAKGHVSRKMREKLRNQAERQLKAAKIAGMTIKWIAPSPEMKIAMDDVLKFEIPVSVVLPSKEVEDALKKGSGSSGSF